MKLGFVIEVLRTHSEIFGTCVKVNTLENESKELKLYSKLVLV